MDENGVARLGFVHADRSPVSTTFAIVGGLETNKRGLLAGAFVVGGIDVEYTTACVGLWFGSGGDGDTLLRLACDSVRIAEHELAFVACGRLEIQDAAGTRRSGRWLD